MGTFFHFNEIPKKTKAGNPILKIFMVLSTIWIAGATTLSGKFAWVHMNSNRLRLWLAAFGSCVSRCNTVWIKYQYRIYLSFRPISDVRTHRYTLRTAFQKITDRVLVKMFEVYTEHHGCQTARHSRWRGLPLYQSYCAIVSNSFTGFCQKLSCRVIIDIVI